MAKIKINGFTELMESVAEWMNVVRDKRRTAFDDVFEKWTVDTIRDAVNYLNRPNWLLSRSIGGKYKKYSDDRKLFALTGFVADRTPSRFTSAAPKYIRESGKSWGRVGSENFKGFTRKFNLPPSVTRSPGFYGKFHENGYTRQISEDKSMQAVSAEPSLIQTPFGPGVTRFHVPKEAIIWKRLRSSRIRKGRYEHTVALHFLKRAKENNQWEVYDAIVTVNASLVEELRDYLKKAQTAQYLKRGFDNGTYRPKVWK